MKEMAKICRKWLTIYRNMVHNMQQHGPQYAATWPTICSKIAHNMQQNGPQYAAKWLTICSKMAHNMQQHGSQYAAKWRTICSNIRPEIFGVFDTTDNTMTGLSVVFVQTQCPDSQTCITKFPWGDIGALFRKANIGRIVVPIAVCQLLHVHCSLCTMYAVICINTLRQQTIWSFKGTVVI